MSNKKNHLSTTCCIFKFTAFKRKPLIKYEVIAQSRSLQKMKHFTDELERAVTVVGSLALSVEPKDPLTEYLCIQLSIYSAISGRKQA